MQLSPYTPGEIAVAVPGRTLELSQVDENLERLRARRLVPRMRIDHGPRGYGKTSLLREYQRRAEEHRLLTIWVTAGETPIVPRLLSELRPHVSGDASRRIRDQIALIEIQAGGGPIGHVRAQLRPSGEQTPGTLSGAVKDAVVSVADGAPHRGLVILIDEIQSADPTGLRALAYAWQELQAEAPDIPAAVFAAGLPSSPDVITKAVTFAERFTYRALRSLSSDAEVLALTAPAAELDVTWSREALDRALDVARGYPYFVQLIGDHTWRAAGNPGPGTRIDAPDVEAGLDLMQEDLDTLYQARWTQATPGERTLMRAIAEHRPDPAPRAALAERLGKSSNALSVPRARLIDKGMIAASQRGSLEFTLPGFGDYIAAQEQTDR